jgi:hypothetical protein
MPVRTRVSFLFDFITTSSRGLLVCPRLTSTQENNMKKKTMYFFMREYISGQYREKSNDLEICFANKAIESSRHIQVEAILFNQPDHLRGHMAVQNGYPQLPVYANSPLSKSLLKGMKSNFRGVIIVT